MTPRQTIADWEEEFGEKCQEHNPPNSPDFTPPLYNVWKQQTKSNAVTHFGNSEPLWLACHTQEEIAEAVEITQPAIASFEKEFISLCAEHNFINSPDFTPPLYNVWKQQTKSNAVTHFGNSEPLWLACHTQEEIAEAVGMDQTAISKIEEEFVKKCQEHNFTNSPDFTPHYRLLDSDPTAYVLSANVHRRHLTKGQQAMAVALAYPDKERAGRGNKLNSTPFSTFFDDLRMG